MRVSPERGLARSPPIAIASTIEEAGAASVEEVRDDAAGTTDAGKEGPSAARPPPGVPRSSEQRPGRAAWLDKWWDERVPAPWTRTLKAAVLALKVG